MANMEFQDKESVLKQRMRETMRYIQQHPEEKMKKEELAKRLTYSLPEFSYLLDIFFEKPLEEWNLQKITEELQDPKRTLLMPYERTVKREWIETEFVRRPEQKILLETIKKETRKSALELGIEKICEQEQKNWKDRIHTPEMFLFWHYDQTYRFIFVSGKNGQDVKAETEHSVTVTLEASDYAVFTLKAAHMHQQSEDTLKMLLKYALCDWEIENQIAYDRNKIYFISYEEGKYYVYIPLKERVLKEYRIKTKQKSNRRYGLDEWLDYIDEHIDEDLTAKRLASVFGYSERHFRNVFQLYYDKKLKDYIRQRKLYYAAERLKMGEKPETVAQHYHFKNTARFSSAFHKEYGISPAQYHKTAFQNTAWLSYIDEHIEEELTLEKLAEVFHYSKEHFRKEFQDIFGIGLLSYITQRRIQFAAKELKKGVSLEEVGSKYGFHSRNGFDKAFRKVFYTSPAKYAKAKTQVVNLNRFYSEYKDQVKVSYIELDEMKMIGWTVIPERKEVDIPAQLAYWLEQDLTEKSAIKSLEHENKGKGRLALWYQEKDKIEYMVGPVVDTFENMPEDGCSITLPAGKYAVFETLQENDMKDLPETIRMLTRCVLYGWIKEHRELCQLERVTFERYLDKKMYFYVPVKAFAEKEEESSTHE